MEKIAIIGCGYIGLTLAKKLNERGVLISATTNSRENLEKLSSITKKSYLRKKCSEEDIEELINDNDGIILTITSDSKSDYESVFLKTAKNILSAAKKLNKKKSLIYTSRCEIYGEQNGMWVDETSKLHPLTDSAKILLETEKVLLSLENLGWDVTILRLSEVYGPGFEISKKIEKFSDYFLSAGRENFTNMIHLDDIASAILYVLDHNLKGIYNLSDDDHMTQKTLTKMVSEKKSMPPVNWDLFIKKKIRGNFRVSNQKIKEAGYSLIHPKRVIS
jgi:nucleoside-diphosphate-sugar epimerase